MIWLCRCVGTGEWIGRIPAIRCHLGDRVFPPVHIQLCLPIASTAAMAVVPSRDIWPVAAETAQRAQCEVGGATECVIALEA